MNFEGKMNCPNCGAAYVACTYFVNSEDGEWRTADRDVDVVGAKGDWVDISEGSFDCVYCLTRLRVESRTVFQARLVVRKGEIDG